MDFNGRLFFSALGLAFMLEALPYVLFPDKMLNAPCRTGKGNASGVRRMGLVAFAAGLAILAFALGRA